MARNAKRRLTASKVFVALDLLLVFIPLSLILVWSFADKWAWPDLFPPELSLRAFEEATRAGSNLGTSVANSLLLAIMTAVICMIVSALAARALVHHDFVGKEAFRFLSIVPFLVPSTVFGMGIQVLFLRLGFSGTIFGVALAHATVAMPYSLAIMIDVTSALGKRQEEQSQVLGATKLQTLYTVIIPSLVPGLLSAAAIAYIESMVQYFLTLIIGNGKIVSLTVQLYPYISMGDRSLSAIYAIALLLTSTIVFLVFEAILKHFRIGEESSFFA